MLLNHYFLTFILKVEFPYLTLFHWFFSFHLPYPRFLPGLFRNLLFQSSLWWLSFCKLLNTIWKYPVHFRLCQINIFFIALNTTVTVFNISFFYSLCYLPSLSLHVHIFSSINNWFDNFDLWCLFWISR